MSKGGNLILLFLPYFKLLEMRSAKRHVSTCSCRINTIVPPVSLMQEMLSRSLTPMVSTCGNYIIWLGDVPLAMCVKFRIHIFWKNLLNLLNAKKKIDINSLRSLVVCWKRFYWRETKTNIVSNFLLFLLMLPKEAIKCLNAAIDIYTDMVRWI